MGTRSSEEVDTRVLEALHRVSREAFAARLKGFEEMEKKILRHLTLLGIFLGVFALSLPGAIDVWKASGGWVQYLFGFSYLGVLASALAGVGCSMRALRWEELWIDPMNEDFYECHVNKSYNELLVSFTKGAVKYYEENQPAFARKECWSRRAYWALIATFVATTLAMLFYILHSLGNGGS